MNLLPTLSSRIWRARGSPVLLRRESAGMVYGLTVDGLGQVSILVPQELAEEAR